MTIMEKAKTAAKMVLWALVGASFGAVYSRWTDHDPSMEETKAPIAPSLTNKLGVVDGRIQRIGMPAATKEKSLPIFSMEEEAITKEAFGKLLAKGNVDLAADEETSRALEQGGNGGEAECPELCCTNYFDPVDGLQETCPATGAMFNICLTPKEVCSYANRELCRESSCCDTEGSFAFHIETACRNNAGATWCQPGCPSSSSSSSDDAAFGDPHFQTWHKHNSFEYHGECDLVLLKAPALDTDIHIRTTIRYDYSFVSQVAVRIGEEKFEVASWGEYQLNNMATVDMPNFIAGYPITSETMAFGKKINFKIHLDQDKDIRIATFKDYVSVRVDNGTLAMFGGSTGIMGDYETGTMYARDGSVLDDPEEFAEEWQVIPEQDGILFSGDRHPQYPQKCVKPAPNAIHARDRKLRQVDFSQEDAEKACAHWVKELRGACIQDVIKTQDIDIAEASFWLWKECVHVLLLQPEELL